MEKKTRRIIIVTGTPSVGKSSVANLLASKLDAVCVDLGELVRKENLFVEVDESRGSLVADMGKVSKRVAEIITQAEGDVVFDGHYAVDVVPVDKVSWVFVLRRNPEELKRFMEERGWVGLKLWENLACEVLDVCLYDAIGACGVERVCEVDVTGRSVEDVVGEILGVLEGKRKCRVGVVDWLGGLEREGRLGEFLREF